MADADAPPMKKMRYSLRSTVRTNRVNTKYQLKTNEKKRKRVKTSLDVLNDHCLLTIFEHMNVNDLYSVARTCIRMYHLARYYFSVNFACFDFSMLIRDDVKKVSLERAQNVLQTFGDQISKLDISKDVFFFEAKLFSQLLALMNKYCSKKITLLHIQDFRVIEGDIKIAGPLFNNLVTLTFTSCFFVDVDWCPMRCLKSFSLANCDTKDSKNTEWPNFEQLTKIDVTMCSIPYPKLANLITKNPNLQDLSITHCIGISVDIFSVIGNLKHLESFKFDGNPIAECKQAFKENMKYLANLNELKKLSVECKGCSVRELMQSFVEKGIAIEYLELSDTPMNDGTTEVIAALKTIKTLAFNFVTISFENLLSVTNELNLLETLYLISNNTVISNNGLKQIVCGAKRLSKFILRGDTIEIDPKTYRAMLEIVQNRSSHNQLKIKIFSDISCMQELASNKELFSKSNRKIVNVEALLEFLMSFIAQKSANDPNNALVDISKNSIRKYFLNRKRNHYR